jgi:hypothetical protein
MSKKRKRGREGEDVAVMEENTIPVIDGDSGEGEEEEGPKVLTSEEEKNVRKKIFHATKELSRAFKKARDFELRKIIKRIKAAKYERH